MTTAVAQVEMQFVLPQDVDVATTAGAGHLVVIPRNAPLRVPLVLVLPGTAPSIPMAYRILSRTIAGWGMPVVALNYPNAVSNGACANITDLVCYEDLLTEVITGQDRSAFTTVTRADSVEYRLLHLLQYLHREAPAVGWDQFFSGDEVLWHRLIVSGHSQGGSVAGMIAKRVRTVRAVIFASMDYNQRQQRVAPWMERPGATPAAAYFALGNERDELVPYAILSQRVWPAIGMTSFGAPLPIESSDFGTVRAQKMNISINGVAHLLVANDNVLLLSPSDQQVLQNAWRHLYEGAAAVTRNAAGFQKGVAAPSSMVRIFAPGVQAGHEYSLRVEGRESRILAVVANEVTAVVPPDVPHGPMYVDLRDGVSAWTGLVEVRPAAPGIFTRDANGEGEATATWVANVVTILGTGWRGSTEIHATLDGVELEILSAGEYPDCDGLDRMELLIPAALRGKAELDLRVEASGTLANPVKLTVPEF